LHQIGEVFFIGCACHVCFIAFFANQIDTNLTSRMKQSSLGVFCRIPSDSLRSNIPHSTVLLSTHEDGRIFGIVKRTQIDCQVRGEFNPLLKCFAPTRDTIGTGRYLLSICLPVGNQSTTYLVAFVACLVLLLCPLSSL